MAPLGRPPRWRVTIHPEGQAPLVRHAFGVYPGDAAAVALGTLTTEREARHEHAPGLVRFTVAVERAH